MDSTTLRAHAHQILRDATIPKLPCHYGGKVRANYDLPDGRRILCAVPFKGQVLTQTARYWFEHTADICPNHVLSYPDPTW